MYVFMYLLLCIFGPLVLKWHSTIRVTMFTFLREFSYLYD